VIGLSFSLSYLLLVIKRCNSSRELNSIDKNIA